VLNSLFYDNDAVAKQMLHPIPNFFWRWNPFPKLNITENLMKMEQNATGRDIGSIINANFSTTLFSISMKSYDPPMHTAEHILNQTMVRMFGCERSFSSHIETKKSKCDYHFDRALSPVEESDLAAAINAVIAGRWDISEKMITLEEAQFRFNLNRLPEDHGEGIRIISVGDYDHCPCIGPHVRNTAEIGQFELVSSSYSEGVLRIRFRLK